MFDFLSDSVILAVIAALLPGALLFIYIYRQDSAQPEPTGWLWKGVGYGILSVILDLCVVGPLPEVGELGYLFDGTTLGALFEAFFYAAIPEEAAKLLMLWLLLRKNPYFDEHLDGIVYATCVGLGFAGLENFLYLIGNYDNLILLAITRGMFSVPAHFFFAVTMGYFISLAHFCSTTVEERSRYYLLAFFVPMIMHGIFDSLLMVIAVNEYIDFICMIAFLFFTNKMRKTGRMRIQILKKKDSQR